MTSSRRRRSIALVLATALGVVLAYVTRVEGRGEGARPAAGLRLWTAPPVTPLLHPRTRTGG